MDRWYCTTLFKTPWEDLHRCLNEIYCTRIRYLDFRMCRLPLPYTHTALRYLIEHASAVVVVLRDLDLVDEMDEVSTRSRGPLVAHCFFARSERKGKEQQGWIPHDLSGNHYLGRSSFVEEHRRLKRRTRPLTCEEAVGEKEMVATIVLLIQESHRSYQDEEDKSGARCSPGWRSA